MRGFDEPGVDLGGWLLAALAAGLDTGVLRAARGLLDRTVMPAPEDTAALRASAEWYRTPALQADPRCFFPFLDAPLARPPVSLAPLPAHASGASRVTLRFASPYEPPDPSLRAAFAAQTENRTAHVQLWLHPAGTARGTAIALHGFGTGFPALDAGALMAPSLYAMGLDVALFTLPHHGARTPAAARFSGQPFLATAVAPINEAIGQAVHDLAVLVAWLRTRGDGPIGVVGLSLGGYVAALTAGLLPGLDFAIPMCAPVCLGDLAYRFMSTSRRYRAAPDAVIPRDELRAAYRIHSPLAHRPLLARERLLIVAGLGDRVVPTAHASWLWAHWGEPALHTFAGGHLAPFGRESTRVAIGRFLSGLGISA